MTEKELRKLGRAELLELLLEQAREFEALEQRLNAAEAALQSQQLQLETCGSIAEASLKLNGVFEAAQKAAEQYQQNRPEPILHLRIRNICHLPSPLPTVAARRDAVFFTGFAVCLRSIGRPTLTNSTTTPYRVGEGGIP